MAKTMHTSRKRAPAPVKPKAKAPAKTPAKKVTVKAKAPAVKPNFMTVHLQIGDWLDVLDNEGTWNVAQVIRLASTKEVEVKYDGWGEEYNEVVAINSGRVAPFHTFTWTVKCWAKYENWPWWPSVVTFRPPGTLAGQEYLTNETRMFVDFLDNKDIAKRCRCWVERAKIKSFNTLESRLRKATDSPAFEASFTRVLQSKASVDFAPLGKGGTLPVEYKSKLTPPVKELKLEVGTRQWVEQMNSSQVRHGGIYSYQPTAIKDDLGFDDEDINEDPYADLGENDWRVDLKPSSKRSSNAPTKQVKVKASTPSKLLRLKAEEGSPLSEGEGRILDGPHAPSPKHDDEEESVSIPNEQSVSDVACTSDEDELASRRTTRLRVRRNREIPPSDQVEKSVQTNKAKRSSRRANSGAPESPIHPEEEGPKEGSESSPAEDTKAVGEGSERVIQVTTSSPVMTTGEEDSEEIPIEIVMPSDEDTSQQDTTEDLGLVDDTDETRDGDARGGEQEPNDGGMEGAGVAEIVSVVDDVLVEVAVDVRRDEDNGEADDDDVAEDNEDQLPSDPLDDWGATRSSGVEGFIEPGIGNSNPPTSSAPEEESPEEASDRTADERAVAVLAAVPENVVRDEVDSAVQTDVALSLEAKRTQRQATGSKRKSTKLLADAERAVLSLLQETEERDVIAQKKSRQGDNISKSGEEKPSNTAKKAPAKHPSGKTPVGKAPTKKAAVAFSSGSANSNSNTSDGSGINAKQATSLQATGGVAREGGRRSSMRAGASGHTEMPRGKTPVWVSPPAKHEPHSEVSSPTSSSSDISVVPTSPPFSSHLNFHSSSSFSMGTWITISHLREDFDPWNAAETDQHEGSA